TAAVKIEYGFQASEASVMHVRFGDGHIAQAGYFKFVPVGFAAAYFHPARIVQGRIGRQSVIAKRMICKQVRGMTACTFLAEELQSAFFFGGEITSLLTAYIFVIP